MDPSNALQETFSIIDLSQPIDRSSPTWTGSCGFAIDVKQDYDSDFLVHKIHLHASLGTHMDAPAHRFKGKSAVGDLALTECIVPLCIIDVREKASEDYRINLQDVEQYENRYGKIPPKSLVIGLTGWYRRWNDCHAYRNADAKGIMHHPAFTEDAAQFFLYRAISGLAIDTLSPDCLDPSYAVHKAILGSGKYIIENVGDCSLVPPRGCYAIALPLASKDLVECPIRLVALVPKKKL